MGRINIRSKGQVGEREIATRFNALMDKAFITYCGTDSKNPYKNGEMPYPFQRNQNQSAVGGSDLSNPFGLSIEVKRQESLSINTWWKQCVLASKEEGAVPVLIYRQSRKPWKVIMGGSIRAGGKAEHHCRVECSIEDFESLLMGIMLNFILCNH